jgi:pentatricopeptide repeat protein
MNLNSSVTMAELSSDREIEKQAGEDALLETVLHDSDHLLRDSLREDDRRRRVRRRIVVSLFGGVLVMGTVLIAALAGWVTLFTPPPTTQAEVDRENWVKRIVGLHDHMQTAFGVGPDLTLLDPDQGLEIVRKAWPKVTRFDVKTGLLKTFAFSKALPAKHPKVLQVLDLGMNDKSPKVREYAASYLAEYAGQNFSNDPKGYAEWYAKNKDKDPNELLKLAKSNAKPDAAGESEANAVPASGKVTQSKIDALNATGWRQFFSGNYTSSESTFRQILKAKPDYPPAMNGLGFSLLNLGNAAEAKPYFEKLLKKEPNGAGYLNGMARCLKEEGKVDEAIAVWEKMVKQSPGVNAGTASLATTYSEKKEYAKAIPYFEQLVKSEPDNQEFKDGLEAAKKGAQSK